jgi:hypothetical protein
MGGREERESAHGTAHTHLTVPDDLLPPPPLVENLLRISLVSTHLRSNPSLSTPPPRE